MKIREIITKLNVARSSGIPKEKSDEIKGIIQNLIPYAEAEEDVGCDLTTVLKALRQGSVLYRPADREGDWHKREVGFLAHRGDRWYLYLRIGEYARIMEDAYPEDHGITWKLTEEQPK